MSYVRCINCDWSQDDFYSKDGYNPAKSLIDWMGPLCEKGNEPFPVDSQWIARNGNLTYKEVIAKEFEKFARNIRNMKWITKEDYNMDPNKVCPKCGGALNED